MSPRCASFPRSPPGKTPVEILEERRAADELNHNLDLEIRTLKKALEDKAEPIKKKIIAERAEAIAAGRFGRISKNWRTPSRRPQRSSEVPGGEV